MPKIKTNRGAAKRFKRTGNGKLKRGSSNRRHILTKRSQKNKRQSRGLHPVNKSEVDAVNRMLGDK